MSRNQMTVCLSVTTLLVVGAIAAADYYLMPMQAADDSALGSTPGGVASPLVGKALPSMLARLGDGALHDLSHAQGSDYTLLLVFSPKCFACELTAPTWAELARENPGLPVYAIAQESVPAASAWLHERGLTHAVVAQVVERSAPKTSWGARGVPLTIVLDSNGVVVFAQHGMISASMVREVLHSARDLAIAGAKSGR